VLSPEEVGGPIQIAGGFSDMGEWPLFDEMLDERAWRSRLELHSILIAVCYQSENSCFDIEASGRENDSFSSMAAAASSWCVMTVQYQTQLSEEKRHWIALGWK
jgi:hypothetical protein